MQSNYDRLCYKKYNNSLKGQSGEDEDDFLKNQRLKNDFIRILKKKI